MSDLWLKEMLALSIVMDDLDEPKMAGRLRVWIERAKALRNEVTELRVEDIRKACAIVGLQDALGETAGESDKIGHPVDVEHEEPTAFASTNPEPEDDDLLEKCFQDRL